MKRNNGNQLTLLYFGVKKFKKYLISALDINTTVSLLVRISDGHN